MAERKKNTRPVVEVKTKKNSFRTNEEKEIQDHVLKKRWKEAVEPKEGNVLQKRR